MSIIVGIHGIGQQLKGEHSLHEEWLHPLRDGLRRSGAQPPGDGLLACAFYGDLFRKKGTKSIGDPPYDVNDVEAGFEEDLLRAWWESASQVEAEVPDLDARTKGLNR